MDAACDQNMHSNADARESKDIPMGLEEYDTPQKMHQKLLEETQDIEIHARRLEERREKKRQAAAKSRKRKAMQFELQEMQLKHLKEQRTAAGVLTTLEQTPCALNEELVIIEVQKNLLKVCDLFRQNMDQFKKLEEEKKKIDKDYCTQVLKCKGLYEQNEELEVNNQDLEQEIELLKEKVANQESTIRQLEQDHAQKLQAMQTQTEEYKKCASDAEEKLQRLRNLFSGE